MKLFKKKEKLLIFMIGMFVISLLKPVYAENEEEETSLPPLQMHSEDCEIDDLDVAIAFAEEYYQGYIARYSNLWPIEFAYKNVPYTSLGTPYLEYNVDGEQAAILYFPVYRDGEIIDIFEVAYHGGRWSFNQELLYGTITGIGEMLDKVDYENNETLIYTINDYCYVETKDTCYKRRTACMVEDAEVYSREEKRFLRLSWEKKKEVIEEAHKNLVKYTDCWYEDKDHSKMGNLFAITEIENGYPEDTVQLIPVLIVLLVWVGIILLFTIRHRRKKKQEEVT